MSKNLLCLSEVKKKKLQVEKFLENLKTLNSFKRNLWKFFESKFYKNLLDLSEYFQTKVFQSKKSSNFPETFFLEKSCKINVFKFEGKQKSSKKCFKTDFFKTIFLFSSIGKTIFCNHFQKPKWLVSVVMFSSGERATNP